MTRIASFAAILILTWSAYLLAAMSNEKALAEAKRLFGPQGNIAQRRGPLDTYWTKQVGVIGPGCAGTSAKVPAPFFPLGEGPNLWEAAFFNVPTGVVVGPFSGMVTLESIAWDDVGVTGFQWIIDGTPLGPEIQRESIPGHIDIALEWDTKSGPQGIHVLCSAARDAAGNVGRSRPTMILLDQSKPSIANRIILKNKQPSVPVE